MDKEPDDHMWRDIGIGCVVIAVVLFLFAVLARAGEATPPAACFVRGAVAATACK